MSDNNDERKEGEEEKKPSAAAVVVVVVVVLGSYLVVNIENNYPTNFGNHEEQRHCE